ncbi:hypothetical protein ACO0KY_14895 [Undibacterium sp. Dicai25W]|uniref:hypothetical protein n=1 Tax=Undibacterium sp. Dicai25W TaxID=3413034 RepID=UPI003BF1F965
MSENIIFLSKLHKKLINKYGTKTFYSRAMVNGEIGNQSIPVELRILSYARFMSPAEFDESQKKMQLDFSYEEIRAQLQKNEVRISEINPSSSSCLEIFLPVVVDKMFD